MGSETQKVEFERPVASVNGEPIGRARRARGNQWKFYNPDVDWFLNEAPGILGEQGMAINIDSGGGGNPADTGPIHDKRIRAVESKAVERFRRLESIWRGLTERSQNILAARYSRKRHWEIRGLKAVFEDLACVALTVTSSRESLERALQKASARTKPIVTETRRRVEKEVENAHLEWKDLQRAQAMRWAEG